MSGLERGGVNLMFNFVQEFVPALELSVGHLGSRCGCQAIRQEGCVAPYRFRRAEDGLWFDQGLL